MSVYILSYNGSIVSVHNIQHSCYEAMEIHQHENAISTQHDYEIEEYTVEP